jgi:signal transduction histidine kinase
MRNMMIPHINDLHVALAAVPFVGALASRELWSRHHVGDDIRSREQRLLAAREDALRAMQEAIVAAERAQRTREEFLERMSHELRTPLNAVIGFSRLLEKNRAGNQRPEDIEMLRRVRAGGEHLLRLVEDVLDQSQIERGQLDVTLEETDVAEITSRVAQRYRFPAAAKGLHMHAVVPTPMPTIRLDPRRFEQILENLVDNAVKFTVSGEIRVMLVTNGATGEPARLVVSDTGIGIATNETDRIFRPFEQVDASARRSYGGAGLGLPLARQLCEAMGCQLTVESEMGVGSRFTIRFPNPD